MLIIMKSNSQQKIAWQQKEIKEVINEIRVTPIKMTSMLDVTVDGMITAEISTRLLGKEILNQLIIALIQLIESFI